MVLDPDDGAASAPSRSLARALQRAGYATLTVTRDPLAAAAALKRRPSVRSDDVAVVGYGSGASTVLATIAIVAATSNLVGGFIITDRMLKMFKSSRSQKP